MKSQLRTFTTMKALKLNIHHFGIVG